jgi:hypothetical protein
MPEIKTPLRDVNNSTGDELVLESLDCTVTSLQ